MFHRSSPLYYSLPLGTWFSIQVRLSIFFPIALLILCYRLESWELGLVFGGVLFVSVFAHELAHVLAAHLTGGSGDEILLWPLGGLAYVRPAATFRSQFYTAAAGPGLNLAVCVLTFPPVWHSGQFSEALNPLVLPVVSLEHDFTRAMFLMTFSANWLLFLVNLIPAHPLDGGRMLRSALSTRAIHEVADELYLRIGFIVALAIMLLGLMFGGSADAAIVFIGAVILALNMFETMQLQEGHLQEERLLGTYDFSHGYTSLEESTHAAPPAQPGLFQRWWQRRRELKQQQLRQIEAEEDQQADTILQKVHQFGMGSLTEAERKLLARASARYRSRSDRPT